MFAARQRLSAAAALVGSLSLAILTAIVLHWSRWSDLRGSLNQGTFSSMLPIFNTASEIGYGAVVASLVGFAAVQAALAGVSANVLVSEAITSTSSWCRWRFR